MAACNHDFAFYGPKVEVCILCDEVKTFTPSEAAARKVERAAGDELAELQRIEERIAHTVCSGGTLARGESERAEELRKFLGRRWDAINRKWRNY